MPIFETPQPISVTVELSAGDVRITASDRTDTVVEVVPSNPGDASDVKAAEQTRVDHVDGKLLVIGPKSPLLDFSKKTRSVDVTIELPRGSRVDSDTGLGDVRSAGELGDCKIKTSCGHVRLDRTGALRMETGAGHLSVDRIAGKAEVTTGTGKIQIGELDGGGTVKSSNGNIEIGTVTGEVRVRAANGEIAVEHAVGDRIEATTSNGAVRVGDVLRGSVVLKTSTGDLEVGVRQGTAALLDLSTGHGRVSNSLEEVASAGRAAETVEVRAHTSFGDITIGRS
ncbi:DUF4097 family beta strand repeat-containing protein [Allokutzneria sp. A3M-2-11 16]|uniref:DUF4097 family beta strand repeat-containing protein n=1 Tax=Allokutzneria sp. A3M-2-11 16 TaxID=2962043 RepID=UPI0020B8EC70|nr:DUF4097 family beta strand repeat-containing protein [Allokutzneria sp. A3M-2-11 16]MCP3805592.1 DUF4097 family beta strand repeat-containing protein [Allokutzneria sp. A3M-2-11 16]